MEDIPVINLEQSKGEREKLAKKFDFFKRLAIYTVRPILLLAR